MTDTPAARLSESELHRLLEVGRALVAELDIEAVLRRILETARDLTEARYAALGILDEDKRELERFVFVGVDEATRREIGPLPRGHGVLGELIRDPRPLRLADVTAHEHSYGFPPGHPPMKTFLGVPIRVRGEAFGNLYLTDKTCGALFDERDEQSALVLSEWAAIAIDNARLYESESRRRAELERAVRGLEATATVARSVGFETELQRVLELIVKRGRALVDASSLLVLLEEGHELRLVSGAGRLASVTTEALVPLEGTLAGAVVRSGAPMRVPRLADRVGHGLETISGGASAALLVPLGFRGRARGVLIAFERSHGSPAFDADDEHLLASFGASAAIAIATAQSVESERLRHSIRASEAERKRWARELHDETLQDLGGLKLTLESGLQGERGDALERAARDAVERLQVSIESLQNLISELRPSALDELGLEPAIDALVARTAAISGIDVEARVEIAAGDDEPTSRLHPELEVAVYRLVQEALTNATKHAAAENAWVEITANDAELTVTVSDDGSGFATEAPTGGFGLVGMRERVELVGGRLEIWSRTGEGTRIRARLPLNARDRAPSPGR